MPHNEQENAIDDGAIVVVSGLPRSGTSMMMAMLEAGGMTLLMDGERQADLDNPKGYFEFARVKKIATERAWISNARGKAVKIISFLLPKVPANFTFKVIFMRRALSEVLSSQQRMLERGGEKAPQDDETMKQLYEKHLREIGEWMAAQSHIDVLYVDYGDTLVNPVETALRVKDFLGMDLNLAATVAAVDPVLYRQRAHRPPCPT